MPNQSPYLMRAADIVARTQSFSHPWNSLSEIHGTMMGRLLGLKRTGVNFARVPPGKESFVYHSHQREEEWIYILSGEAQAEIDDSVCIVRAGDFLAFPTGVAHHLRNQEPKLALTAAQNAVAALPKSAELLDTLVALAARVERATAENQYRFAATQATDPLFAPIDGANCPTAVPARTAASPWEELSGPMRKAYSLLLARGTIRMPLPWPPRNADGTVKPVAVRKDATVCLEVILQLDPEYTGKVVDMTAEQKADVREKLHAMVREVQRVTGADNTVAVAEHWDRAHVLLQGRDRGPVGLARIDLAARAAVNGQCLYAHIL